MSFNPVFPTLFGSGVSGATKVGSVLGSQVGLFTGTMLGGFSGAVYDPSLPIWSQGVADLLAGISTLRVLNIGDSTTIGINGLGVQTDPNEYKQVATTMGAYFDHSEQDAFFGFSTSGTLAGSRLKADNRVVNGGAVNSSIACLGGLTGRITTAGNYFTFKPDGVCDTFRVYWWYNGAVGVDFTATGGTPYAVTLSSGSGTQFGTTDIRYVDVSAATLTAGNILTITKTSGASNLEIVGIEAWDSTTKRLQLVNCGHFGSRSTNWAVTTGGGRNPSDFLAKVPAGYFQLATIKPPINDAGGTPTTIPTFKANIQIVINACRAGGMDVVLETGNPRSDGLEVPYIAAMVELAIANNIFLLNTHDDIFIDYATAVSNGYMVGGDGLHPTVLGFTQQSNALVALLVSQGGL